MTIAEICIVGQASVLIPFPYAVDDHQTSNGRYLMDIGGCRMIQERDCTPELFAGIFDEYFQHPENLDVMASKSRAFAKPDATEDVANLCLEYLHA